LIYQGLASPRLPRPAELGRSFGSEVGVTDYRVVIPNDRFHIVEFRQEDMPGIAVVNEALVLFEPKVVFDWHLSIMLKFEDLVLNGMPSRAERELVDPWESLVEAAVKGEDPDKPNALFLARITWNATRELIYRVYEPEAVNRYLVNVIDSKSYPREFDYRMEHDPRWELAKWHINACCKSR
jgi:hypothetical protein